MSCMYLIDAEQSSGHRGAPDGLGGILVLELLAFRDRVPVELQIPVETADVHAPAVPIVVLQRRVVDDVDHGTHHRRRIPGYPVQERFQPPCRAFAVGVQVG